jgi:anti-anti-sigma factor
MSPQPFRIIERGHRPDLREIEVAGELDLAVADRFEEALEGNDDCTGIVVDLRRCEFIEAGCIGVIVRARRRIEERGGRLLVVGPEGQVRRVLSITGQTVNGSLEESGR